MKVYIAGKITGDEHYRAKFAEAEQLLEEQGHIVLNPAMLPGGMTYADYLRIDFAMIDVADVVVFLPDWKDSKGALVEMRYCRCVDKPLEIWEERR